MRLPNRPLLRYGLIGLAIGALLLVPRIFVNLYAAAERTSVLQSIAQASTDDEAIERFARWAAGYWDASEKKDVWNYLRKLPPPFRPDKEPVSFLSAGGQCSEFVSAARWVLGDRFEVVRHDLFFPVTGHSAVSLRLADGRWVFIDPFYGLIFKAGDKLLNLKSLRTRLAAGDGLLRYAVALHKAPAIGLYAELLRAADGREGETVDIWIDLPVAGHARWTLGKKNKDWRDAQRAGINAELTSHFFYLGKRYPAEFRFHYRLPKDGLAYELRFHLVEPADVRKLPKFSTMPIIKGRTVSFQLAAESRVLTADSARLRKYTWQAIDWFEVVALQTN